MASVDTNRESPVQDQDGEYTGTTPEEMEGWGWRSVHDPTLLSSIEAQWRRVMQDRCFTFNYSPLRNAEGAADRVIAVVSDVTAQVESRQRVEALAAELAKRLEAALAQIRKVG